MTVAGHQNLLPDEGDAEIINELGIALNDDPSVTPPDGGKTEAEQDPAQVDPADAGQPRDERGRFAQKTEAEVAADDQERARDAHIPSWRLREVTEAREAAERRAAEFERRAEEAERWRAQQERQAQQRQQQQQQTEPVDPLADPDGYVRRIQDGVSNELRTMRLNFNLELAQVRHGDVFNEAFDAFMTVAERNKQFGQAVINGPNPGEAIVTWYRGQKTLHEIGGDPQAYRKKIEDELLANPEFQRRVVEHLRNGNAQTGNRPQSITKLPPSLSRAAGSSTTADAGAGEHDDSDAGILRASLRR